jgi:hypothetical protein
MLQKMAMTMLLMHEPTCEVVKYLSPIIPINMLYAVWYLLPKAADDEDDLSLK